MHDHSSSRISSLRIRKGRLMRKTASWGLVFLISAFGIFFVWQRVQVIKLGYEVESLKKERDALTRTNKGLLIEASTLTSPDRIEGLASSNIGMHSPSDSQVVLVKRIKRVIGARPPDGSRQVRAPAPGPGRS